MTAYTDLALAEITFKERKTMLTALTKIETEGLPNELVKKVKDYFIKYAGTTKTNSGVISVMCGATKIIGDSNVSDKIYQDFLAKDEAYISAIVEDNDKVQSIKDSIKLNTP